MRSTGDEQRFPSLLRQAANIHRMKAIHVFIQTDRVEDFLLVQTCRQG